MQQRSFGSVEYEHKKVKTRRQRFLERMDVTCPPRTGPSTGLENLCRCGRRGRGMSKRKRYAAEEIIAKLREAEVHLAQGDTVGQAVRKLGVSEQTYYRWRREYGGLKQLVRGAGAGQLDPA